MWAAPCLVTSRAAQISAGVMPSCRSRSNWSSRSWLGRSTVFFADDFAAILLDVQMPGMNGFEVAEFIKSRERSRTIPIIFLSAISKEDAYVYKGYSMGAVDYVFKPFNPDILRSKVAVFLDL